MASKGADGSAGQLLLQASQAESSGARAKYATRGLAEARDPTLRAMLMRQLYLSHVESSRFEAAREIAQAVVELGVMPDVACQDLARAYLALGREQEALEQMRRASRVGPASRRAFHLWTLGSLQYLRGEHRAAVSALERASRWGTTARPLYEAQLFLARCAATQEPSGRSDELARLRARLEAAPCGRGYGRFVLGELAHRQGDFGAARNFLREFSKRADSGRVALRVALSAERKRAQALLDSIHAELSAKL